MIALDFSLPVKYVRNDVLSFNVGVINSTIETLVFVFNWDFILFLMLLGMFANKLCFWRTQEIQDLLASALVEAGAQDTGSWMPSTLKLPYHKWEGSLFTLALLHNFTLVKVKEVCLTGWAFLHLVKCYSSHLKMLCEDKSWYYCSCR